MAEEMTDTLPRRRFLSSEVRELPVDKLGFFEAATAQNALCIEDLFALKAALIVASPWTGKTFVAKRIESYFRHHMKDDEASSAPFGEFFCLTSFHEEGLATASSPDWWAAWREGAKRACWIVDAIDEDFRRDGRQVDRILSLVDRLDIKERGRLRLLMFVRQSEIPPKVKERLEKIYPPEDTKDPPGLVSLQLAPLDERSARDHVGSDEAFRKVCHLIEQHGLQAIAGLPCVLDALVKLRDEKDFSESKVWRSVLVDLLRERRPERDALEHACDAEDRFTAACWMAATLTLSGLREVGSGESSSCEPTVADLFPPDARRASQLRRAAHSVPKTAAFRRTAAGFEFAQRHVQEWLTAFALQDVSLERLRPFVADRDGQPFAWCGGVLTPLLKTSHHDDVKDWISESHGGVPPRSDAAPMGLDDAVKILDRLQALARRSVYGLHFWPDRGLERIAAPGLGATLATRLGDRGLSLNERELLFLVARAVEAAAVARVAEVIVSDSSEDERLRTSAAYFLSAMANDEQYERLGRVARSAQPQSRQERAAISCLITTLWERGHWSLLQAARYAPDDNHAVTDATTMLHHRLRDSMQLEDAREILRRIDWNALTVAWGRKDRRRLPQDRRSRTLLGKALGLLSSQASLCKGDYDLLFAALFTSRDLELEFPRKDRLVSVFARDTEARRRLFHYGLEQDATGSGQRSWVWRLILTAGDLDWLKMLAEQHSATSPWLWGELLRLTYRPEVGQAVRNQIRCLVRKVDESIVESFDRKKDKWRARERRRKAKSEERQVERERQRVALGDYVQMILDHRKLSLHQRMHSLSSVCFTGEHTRPWNLVGTWDQLDARVQSEVLTTCQEALQSCKPAPIPSKNAYPAAIVYEAHAFVAVAEQVETFGLTSELIRNWLPSTMVFSMAGDAALLARCMSTDRLATEDVVYKETRRELTNEQGRPNTAFNLPSEYWSERLAMRAATLVVADELNLDGRCELLKLLAFQRPDAIRDTAQEWLKESSLSDSESALRRTAALDAMILIDPDEALPELRHRAEAEGAGLLEQLDALPDLFPGGRCADLNAWNAGQVEQLCDVLQTAYPPADAGKVPDVGGFQVTRKGDLRRLRDHLPVLLLERNSPGDAEALERLAARYPDVRTWKVSAVANQAAGEVLAQTCSPSVRPHHPGTVPFRDVVRLLEDTPHRLIRSPRDLQCVLVEELRAIGKTARQDLPMLYRPRDTRPKAGRKDVKPTAAVAPRNRLHEDALQAYLKCRLRDRLPGHVLDRRAQVLFINRETLAAKDQRLDLRVEAPTVEGQTATVVIEVKWSDRDKVSSSLAGQLGTEYLLGNNLTHGIYFVGFYHKRSWPVRQGVLRPTPVDSPGAWEKTLLQQAERFEAENKGIRIVPVVVDLRWEGDRGY